MGATFGSSEAKSLDALVPSPKLPSDDQANNDEEEATIDVSRIDEQRYENSNLKREPSTGIEKVVDEIDDLLAHPPV